MGFSRQQWKIKALPHAVALAVSTLALSPLSIQTAHAQQADSNAPTTRVEITGSNIRRADKETISPVQVLTAEDLKKSGYTSINSVLQNITANGQGSLSTANSEAFAGGAGGIALRGLTVGATLVLIDGHRMAPYPLTDDGQRQFVDTENIPFDAVDRIEVLKDGASAVYGSDAIAGVVNVILKKSFTGTNISADGGTTTQGGGTTYHATLTHGFGNLESDGYTAYISGEYRSQDAIYMSQRAGQSWNNLNFTSIGGNNLTPGAVNQFNGGQPNTATPYFYDPTKSGNDPTAYAFLPGCSYTAMQASQCTYSSPYTLIQPKTQNANLIGSFTKKLGGDWEMNIKASFFGKQTEQNVGNAGAQVFPGPAYSGASPGNLFPGSVPVLNVGFISSFTVPANYPGNTLGVPAVPYGRIADIPPGLEKFDQKTYRLVADFTGTLGGWDVATSVGYTKIELGTDYQNFINFASLYASLNGPNPYLIGGQNSAATINSIAPKFSGKSTDELDFVEVRGSRELFKLDGGAFSISTGASFVHKSLNNPIPGPVGAGTQPGAFQAYAIGQQNDAAAYAEFVAPVLKTLEIDGAARLDHYNTYGNSFTPKIGFKFTPSEAFAVRGTASTGFRAPNPAENGTASLSFGLGQTIVDPVLCPGGNPNTKGNFVAQCSLQPGYVQQTTPNLQPEKSRSYTLGLILEPIKGWSSTLDYYNIEIRDQIVTAAQFPSYTGPFVRGIPTPQQVSDGAGGTTIATPPVGNILIGYSPYVNANSTKVTGLEFQTQYKFKLGEYGSLTTQFQWAHTLSYELTQNGHVYELAGTHGPSGVSGDTGNPRDKMQFTVSYDNGPLNVATTFNYIGRYGVTDPSGTDNFHDCQSSLTSSTYDFANVANPVPTKYCEVKGFLDTDLHASYKLDKHWTIQGSVTNLFNAAPPLDYQTYGGGFYPYNPALHQAGAIGRIINVGASYRF